MCVGNKNPETQKTKQLVDDTIRRYSSPTHPFVVFINLALPHRRYTHQRRCLVKAERCRTIYTKRWPTGHQDTGYSFKPTRIFLVDSMFPSIPSKAVTVLNLIDSQQKTNEHNSVVVDTR